MPALNSSVAPMPSAALAAPTHMRSRLATSLRKLRLGQGLTQAQMGARYGVARSTWGGYERKESMPHSRLLLALHVDYGISLDYLLGIRSQVYHPTEGMFSNIKRRNPLPRIPG